MNKILLPIIAIVLLASCNTAKTDDKNTKPTGVTDDTLNTNFKQYSDKFIEALWLQEPEWATNVGYHEHDAILTIPDSNAHNNALLFIQTHLDSIKKYDLSKLTPSHQIDLQMMQNYLQAKHWSLEELKEYSWNPSSYNITGLIAFMLTEQYEPLDKRLQSCHQRMLKIPAYYAAAKTQIKNPVNELRELAIDQNLGGLSIFEKDYIDSVNKSALPAEEKTQMVAAAHKAATAVKDYVSFLKSLPAGAGRSFRLGKDLYDKKFEFDIQSSYTAQQNYDSAMARKTFLHSEMAKISRSLWSKYFGTQAMPTDSLILIGKLIDTISQKHTTPAEFQSTIEKQIPELEKFINDKKLLYLDPSKPLVVRKEPAYMAGVAGASISAPGPYDKNGNTYYNVGSLEGWPAAQAESYLREYNHYILQILNIHEAIPGHYTQLVYANRSPSLIKSILGNGAMIEGWAVYTEQMMLENGYGNNEPEMWLMWYKWNLRTVCNTILDYSVHVNNMSKNDAMQLLTKQAFQQQAEAEGKWKRVSVTSVQLTSYYSGYKAIYDLREKIKSKEGKKYDLRIFNEKFLSYGSAPVKFISQLMLNQ